MLACTAPPEILAEIFHIVHRDVIHDIRSGSGELRNPYHLLVVAWVCHSWRLAALGCPTLWSTIFYRFPLGLVEWMVHHASPCPIIVYAGQVMRYQSPRSILPILQEFTRVREFHLGVGMGYPHEAESVVRSIRALSTLPLLEVLDFSYDADLSGVSMPSLRNLTLGLTGRRARAIFPAAPDLTALTIYNWHSLSGQDVHCTMSFIAAHYPALVSLTLSGEGNREQTDQPGALAPADPVSLPALEMLHLSGATYQISSLATYVRVPRSCKVAAEISLTWSESSWDAAAAREIGNLLRMRTDGPGAAYSAAHFDFACGFVTVMLDETPPNLRSAMGWRATVDKTRYDDTCALPMPTPVILSWKGIGWLGHREWLDKCDTMLPLEDLLTVTINADSSSIIGDRLTLVPAWKAFLRRMNRVESLRINEQPLYYFLSTLTYNTPVLLPSLRRLVMDGICPAENQDSKDWVRPEDYFPYFVRREKSGVPLEHVSFSACGHHKYCQDRLARVVKHYKYLSLLETLGISGSRQMTIYLLCDTTA